LHREATVKLYIIVREALSTGLKIAQACHALRAFVGDYPHLDAYWHAEHNNIVVLQVDDIDSLADRLEAAGFRISKFREPDLDDQLTAFAAEPAAWKHLSSLRLAA
jgi:hypothetical protein